MTDIPWLLTWPPSARKRFYEPVILLDALRAIYLRDNGITEPDLEAADRKSLREIYFCFLNKLSQICDNQPKQPLGKTVTSFVILDSGTIEYFFASNNRDDHELAAVTDYVTGILNLLGGVTEDQVVDKTFMAGISARILQRVLVFNRPRIESYMEALCKDDRLEFCIWSSNEDGTNDGRSVSGALRQLQPRLEAARNVSLGNDDDFASHAGALLRAIDANYQSTLEDYMKRKTRGDNNIVDSSWGEVRHALGRLLSYFIAIKVLISARDLWPRIFVDFQVTGIPSSEPSSDPPAIRRNAKGIIDRMGRNRETLEAYQVHAQRLQSLGLDDLIKGRVHASRFRPIVHAEVNLLDWVLRHQAEAEADGDDPVRFFNEAEFGRYIGTSKPTCLLCHFYFAAHPSGVKCRLTHGNLYYNWRDPDLLQSDGPEAARQRQEIVENMIKEVRIQTGRAIKERSYTRRKHDSRDTPSNPLWSTARGGSPVLAEDDDLPSRLGQINLDTASMRDWASTRERWAAEHSEDGRDGEEDDDDGGGARL